MDQHELITALINMAQELGRTPVRDEFYASYPKAQHAITKHYGRQYNAAVLAAGLAVNSSRRLTNEIFKKDIVERINTHQSKPIQRSKQYPNILIIGDLHFPFVHKKSLEACHAFAKEFQPKYIIQIGDIFDLYSHAKFPRSHNLYTPKEEEDLARTMAERMWKKFSEDCPEAKKIQLCGNHDLRPMKRTLELVPQLEHWVEKYFKELMSFEGVETIFDSREEYKIEDIVFIHGYASGVGRHRDHIMANVCNGHTHTGHVSYRQMNDKILWELNVGYLADQYAKGLTYTPTKTVKWTLGWGVLDSHGPRFIPY